MRKVALCLVSSLALMSCKEGSKSGGFMNSNNDEIIGEVKSDNFVGKWRNISAEDEIVVVTKKYDNVYIANGIEMYKKYAANGTVYLEGNFKNQVEVQLIYDEYTQHLLFRHPFDFYEFERIE